MMTSTNTAQGSRDGTNSGTPRTRKEKLSIILVALCFGLAVLLIALDITMIAFCKKPNIKNSVDTVMNAQILFNKLGMQLSTNVCERDKTATHPLVNIGSVTIVVNVILLLFCCIYGIYWKNRKEIVVNIQWRGKALIILIIGFMHIGLVISRSIYVTNMQPPESSKTDKTTLLKSLHLSYKNDSFSSTGNAESDTWNKIFIEFQCCAVNAVTSTTNDFDLTPWCTTAGSCQETSSQIPKACCKGANISTLAQKECYEYVRSGYHEQGCAVVWQNSIQKLIDETQKIYKLGITSAVFHVITMVLAVCLVFNFIDLYVIQEDRS